MLLNYIGGRFFFFTERFYVPYASLELAFGSCVASFSKFKFSKFKFSKFKLLSYTADFELHGSPKGPVEMCSS